MGVSRYSSEPPNVADLRFYRVFFYIFETPSRMCKKRADYACDIFASGLRGRCVVYLFPFMIVLVSGSVILNFEADCEVGLRRVLSETEVVVCLFLVGCVYVF